MKTRTYTVAFTHNANFILFAQNHQFFVVYSATLSS